MASVVFHAATFLVKASDGENCESQGNARDVSADLLQVSRGPMNRLKKFLRDLLTSKELALTRAENARLAETNAVLEEELSKTRAELRGVINTVLSQAGVTPLPSVAEEAPKPIQRIRHLTLHQKRRADLNRETRAQTEEAKELAERVKKRMANG